MTIVAAPTEERRLVDVALHAGRAGVTLRAALGIDDRRPCHVLDAKYEAGSYCTVLYRLGDDLVTSVLTFDGAPPPGGVAVDRCTRAYRFPDDPRLPGLGSAMDSVSLASALGCEGAEVTLVRYRPGKRATLRIDVRGRTGGLTLFGKVYADTRKATAVHAEASRLAPLLDGQSALRTAPLEGFLPDVPMVLWRAVPGRELDGALDGRAGPDHVSAAAGALAVLHAAPPISERRRPVAAELARFGQRAARAAGVAPDAGALMQGLAAAVAEAGQAIEHPEPGLVHGDCKPTQFRLSDAGLALLDFDHCGLADPASDVGTFMASLCQRSRHELEPVFLSAYAEAAGADEADVARAHWYEAVALTRKALRAFARAPRSPLPGILVAAGHDCLERGRS